MSWLWVIVVFLSNIIFVKTEAYNVSKNCTGIICKPVPSRLTRCKPYNRTNSAVDKKLGDYKGCCPMFICYKANGKPFLYTGIQNASAKAKPRERITRLPTNGSSFKELPTAESERTTENVQIGMTTTSDVVVNTPTDSLVVVRSEAHQPIGFVRKRYSKMEQRTMNSAASGLRKNATKRKADNKSKVFGNRPLQPIGFVRKRRPHKSTLSPLKLLEKLFNSNKELFKPQTVVLKTVVRTEARLCTYYAKSKDGNNLCVILQDSQD